MRALPLFLACLPLFACPSPMGSPDAAEEFDAGTTVDSGVADAGTRDAGSVDAGVDGGMPEDAGTPDAGSPDAGPVDAGGLAPAPLVSADASISIEDAGYAESDLLGRDPMVTVPSFRLDGGFAVAISAQSLVVAEGSACELSFVNRYTCDYRWISPSGTTLARVPNAYGGTDRRGEVMMLFRDQRTECPDPFFANRFIESAIPSMLNVETGATRLSWPRTETGALRNVMDKGDLVPDPKGERSCDAGAPFNTSPLTTWTRVRAPYEKFVGASAFELGAQRLLLIDGGNEVSRIEADGGRSTVVSAGPAAWVQVELDTFTLRRGDQFSRSAIDGGALRPVGTWPPPYQLGFEGGRFAKVTEVPDYSTRRVIDTEGVMPDLRYPMEGSLLQRAPVMFGVNSANELVVARVDQGVAATLPFLVTASIYTWSHFPHDDAALLIDRNNVAWMIETSGVKRVTDHAVNVPFRSFTTPPGAPNVLLVVRRLVTGGPLELLAVDRQTQRIVRLSDHAFVNLRASYLGACDVPGMMSPGNSFIYFAETTAQPGEVELFLVRSDLSELPRRVGRTLASNCTAPIVSRDGTRIAVQETLGGPVTISVGTW